MQHLFEDGYRRLITKDIAPNDLKQMLKKFIHRVDVGVEAVRVHWLVDDKHYDRELALIRAASRPSAGILSFNRNDGAHSLRSFELRA